MRKSRLSTRRENQTKKSFLISLLGIIAIIFVFVKFGIPLLVNVTLFISGAQKNVETQKDKNQFLSPPVLDSLPQATNSARINITGTDEKDRTINLYVNGDIIDKTETDDDGNFSFERVRLSKGENKIKVKTTKDKSESAFSPENSVFFIDTPPSLTIDSPQDDKTFSKDENPITISGKTDPGVKITINDLWAIVRDDGAFTYTFSLKSGENQLKISATDIAGNKTEVVKKATLNQ